MTVFSRFPRRSIVQPFMANQSIPFRLRHFSALPTEADAVIIGGGSVGSSVFYHLLKDHGLKNVVLVERDAVTSGTTWHSAGMLWRLRPSDSDVIMQTYTRNLAKKLHEEVEIESFFENGGLFMANNNERLNEYKRLAETGKYFGIESHIVSPEEAKKIHPLMNTSDVTGALYSPTDGTMDPTSWVMALLKAGKKLGGKVFEKTQVVSMEHVDIDCNFSVSGSVSLNSCKKIRKITGVKVRDPTSNTEQLIKTPMVVNACGAWARNISLMAGADIPLRAMKHAFVVTEKLDGMQANFPNVRDHDLSIYLKAQGDSLALGGYEQNPEFCDHLINNPNSHFSFGLFDLDFDTFAQNLDGHIQRCPQVEEVGIKSTVCGPESFTPDHKPLVGPQPGIFGLFQACGFNSMGLMLAGGMGKQIATWICKGSPEIDLFNVDCSRFHPETIVNDTWVKDRTHESYAKTYAIVFPHDESLAGRGMRKSGVYDDLKANNCVFQARHAFERPGWFLDESNSISTEPKVYDYYGAYPDEDSVWRLFGEDVPKDQYPTDFLTGDQSTGGKPKYQPHDEHLYHKLIDGELSFDTWGESFDLVKKECQACREGVAVFDQSYFGKFHVKGKDAQAYIQFLAGSDFSGKMSNKSGTAQRVTYTVLCNDFGGVEADLTIGKISDEHFYISAGGNTKTKDLAWMQKIAWNGEGEDGRVYKDLQIVDSSDEVTILSVQGPQSRDLLEKTFMEDLKSLAASEGEFFSEKSFPFSYMREMEVRCGSELVNFWALRLTFVGERGYELHVPSKHASTIYHKIMSTAKNHAAEFPLVRNAGYRAIDSLSAEKSFRHWHADLTNGDTPMEAGIGFTVLKKLEDTKINFKGRQALEKKRAEGLQKKLVCLILDSEKQVPLHGLETIWRDGKCVGYIKSTAYGFSIGKQIAYGYVDCPPDLPKITNKWLESTQKWEIGDKGERRAAVLSLKAPVDPENLKVKGSKSESASFFQNDFDTGKSFPALTL